MLLAIFDMSSNPTLQRELEIQLAALRARLGASTKHVTTSSGFILFKENSGIEKQGLDYGLRTNEKLGKGLFLDGRLFAPPLEELWSKFINGPQHALDTVVPTTINGSFNLIAWENHPKKIVVANDRLGFRCLYFWISDDRSRLVLSTTLELLRTAVPGLKPDRVALGQQLLISSPTRGRSLLEKTSRLLPGDKLTLTPDGFSLSPHLATLPWGDEHYHLTVKEAAELITDVAAEAVKDWAASSGVTVSLSGGYDSRFITLLAMRALSDVDAVNLGDDDWIDSVLAGQFCQAANVGLTRCPPPDLVSFDEYIRTVVWVEHVSDYLSPFWLKPFSAAFKKDRIVMNGFFGGPLTGSPIKWLRRDGGSWADVAREWYRAVNRCNVSDTHLKNLCNFSPEQLKNETVADLIAEEPSDATEYYQRVFYLEWVVRQCGFVTCDTYNLFRTFSTVAVPFADHRLLQVFTNLPEEHLSDQKAYISAVQTLDKSGVPFASTSSRLLLPTTYAKGPQQHIERHFRELLKDAFDYITGHRHTLSEYFQVDALAELFTDKTLTDNNVPVTQRLMLLNAAILLNHYSA